MGKENNKSKKLFLKAAEICLQKNIPFCLHRFPETNKILITISKKEYSKINIDKQEKNIFIFSPFIENKKSKTIYLKNDIQIKSLIDIETLKKIKKNTTKKFSSNKTLSTTKSEYENNFNAYQKYFKNTKTKKAILSRLILENLESKFNVFDYYKSLNKKYSNTFNYLFYTRTTGLWIGATPEWLLNFKNNTFKTPALAGTLPIKSDLKWGEKEIEEHNLVCKQIKEVYKKHHLKLMVQKPTKEIKAGAIKHLLTEFTFKNASKNFILNKLIQDLHPTPAVAGYPKKNALKLISKIEKHSREYYTGYLGLINKKESQLFVNLRCMKIENKKAIIFVGGGMTRDSIMDREWNETELKSTTLLKII